MAKCQTCGVETPQHTNIYSHINFGFRFSSGQHVWQGYPPLQGADPMAYTRPIDSHGNFASLTWDVQTQAYVFRFAYDKDFLALFKQYVLAQNRVPVYGPKRRDGKQSFSHWVVDERVFDALRAICEAKWPRKVHVESRADVERKLREAEAKYRVATPGAAQPTAATLYAEFNVFLAETGVENGSLPRDVATLDFDTLKRLYRQMAVKLHPDKGGDPSRMAKLNTLWKQLQQLLQPKGA